MASSQFCVINLMLNNIDKMNIIFDSGSPVLRGGVRGRGARGGVQRGKDVVFYVVKTLNLFSIYVVLRTWCWQRRCTTHATYDGTTRWRYSYSRRYVIFSGNF